MGGILRRLLIICFRLNANKGHPKNSTPIRILSKVTEELDDNFWGHSVRVYAMNMKLHDFTD